MSIFWRMRRRWELAAVLAAIVALGLLGAWKLVELIW